MSNTTIADVARIANVSVSTVSRILNDKPDVAEKTRQRVQAVIEELGFVPHAQAQSLRAGRGRMIAIHYPIADVALSRMDLDFFVGAAKATEETGFFVNFITQDFDETGLLNLYRSEQMDGLVVMHVHIQDWRVEVLREYGFPFVMIGRCEDNEGLSYVDLDFEQAIAKSVDHLAQLGHETIGLVDFSGDLYDAGYGPAVRARRGFEQACQDFPIDGYHQGAVRWSYDAVFDATMKLLDECPELTAIVNINGPAVIGTIRALQQRGRSIPKDCSVVGLASSQANELITPPLTAVDFPSYKMGYEATRMLAQNLQAKTPNVEQILLNPDVTVRESTAPRK